MSCPQVSFLQMLNGVTQSEEEQQTEQEEEEEDKQQLRFQIHQRLQCESNLQRFLETQNRYSRLNPTAKIEPFRSPAEQQLDSCITQSVGPSNTAAVHVGPNERKKRKRSRAPPPPGKDEKESESQRMNHIAVERNRRRLMNNHLSTLRSLMPSSFVQRADQASIVAGAIDFVKELEQLLLSLQAKKRIRSGGDATATTTQSSASSSCTNDEEACHMAAPASEFFISPQYTGYTEHRRGVGAQDGGAGADVEATVVQGHVNLKVVGPRRRGQLVRAIAAVEGIGLSVLHLNVTSLDDDSILFSLNLKMEDECKLGSADEIATAVHQIFSYINAC